MVNNNPPDFCCSFKFTNKKIICSLKCISSYIHKSTVNVSNFVHRVLNGVELELVCTFFYLAPLPRYHGQNCNKLMLDFKLRYLKNGARLKESNTSKLSVPPPPPPSKIAIPVGGAFVQFFPQGIFLQSFAGWGGGGRGI